jgi:hypothetical protein
MDLKSDNKKLQTNNETMKSTKKSAEIYDLESLYFEEKRYRQRLEYELKIKNDEIKELADYFESRIKVNNMNEFN